MANCKKCNVELTNDNWAQSLQRSKLRWCNSCRRAYQKAYDGVRREEKKAYIKVYNKKNYEKLAKLNANLNKSIPPAVYCVKEKDVIIYIGSSVSPYKRKSCHLSVNKFNGEINNSAVAQAMARGEINREDLSFEIMEEIVEKYQRHKRELELIRQYKPKYNTYYDR